MPWSTGGSPPASCSFRRGVPRISWKTRLNNLDPSFRTKRHEPLKIIGISTFAPRLETGGPLIKDRLFLQQAAQYRYRTSEVPSRPQEDLKTAHAFSSFTRLDANLSARHVLVAAGRLLSERVHARDARHVHAAERRGRSAQRRRRAVGDGAVAVERCAVLRDHRRDEPVPLGGPAPESPADGAAAGDHARQLLQSADAHHLHVSGDRNALGLAERSRWPAPFQSRARSPAQPVLRDERQRTGPDPALRRQTGAPAGLRPSDCAVDRQHRRGAVRSGSRAAEFAVVSSNSAGASTATASSGGSTSRRASARRCC